MVPVTSPVWASSPLGGYPATRVDVWVPQGLDLESCRLAVDGVLGLQIWESVVSAREFTPKTDTYGSLFFTITGAHSAHLVAGLLLLAWVQVRAWFSAYSTRRHLGVQMASFYWHFVVAVQLAIFVTLYLTPILYLYLERLQTRLTRRRPPVGQLAVAAG